jgi:hypothetical protein
MSILESSHPREGLRGDRELLGISDDYAVLLLQGGASLQFSMVPMNLLLPGETADYANSGAWGLQGHQGGQEGRRDQHRGRLRQGDPHARPLRRRVEADPRGEVTSGQSPPARRIEKTASCPSCDQ